MDLNLDRQLRTLSRNIEENTKAINKLIEILSNKASDAPLESENDTDEGIDDPHQYLDPLKRAKYYKKVMLIDGVHIFQEY